MSAKSFKISDAELEVMRILWREKQAVSFHDIRTELSDKMGWEKSTIATLLRRLQKKGAVSIREKEIHYYEPNIAKEDYAMQKKRSLIDKLYDGSTKNFVAALCQNGELTEADIDELKTYFQMGDGNK
ncbi:MAG: BlaI/MecI/CopY family transcriptional regulator [Acetatifactor sp.]|nr:BlaI/MecI/CopY family transcriptional regulator [Acetatifactor sp.]MDE7044505.1 BlaI/MecI/CopY family transcriptional regulator [Acetatifactor sp.]